MNNPVAQPLKQHEPAPAGNFKPVLYSCSGCSDAGELADRVARTLSKRGVGEMSCLAGIGGKIKPLLQKARKAERIVVIDGCPLNCARHTLLQAGLAGFKHIGLHHLGHRKGACPVTDDRVAEAAGAAEQLINKREKVAIENGGIKHAEIELVPRDHGTEALPLNKK